MEESYKVHKPSECPTKGARADNCLNHLASAKARATGDYDTPCTQEHQAMFVIASWTLVARMFISLGLNDKIVNAIVDEQGYNTSHALSHWTKTLLSSLSLPSANLVE